MRSTTNSGKPRVDILTPVHNEELGLAAYRAALGVLMERCTDIDLRVLFIDDGSADKSWHSIREICAGDARFSAIRLSRNFGSHIALSAGFHHINSDAAMTLACDLQDPPETLLAFLERWRSGAEIVWGKRKSRDDGWWRPLCSGLLFEILRRFAMPQGSRFTTGSFFLVDGKVIRSLKKFREHNRTTFALVAWTGFEQAIVEYDRQPRRTGRSGWNFRKMVTTMYDTILGFSFVPVRIMTALGGAVFLLAVAFGIYVLSSWATGTPLPGWTSISLILSFFFGLQFLMMGLVGEYLYRIYSEVLNRPLYFVSDEVNRSSSAGGCPDD